MLAIVLRTEAASRGPAGRDCGRGVNVLTAKHLRLTCRNAQRYALSLQALSSGLVTITLNGEPYQLDGPVSVVALLAALAIDGRRVAVEHNLVVVRRALFETTMIGEGDEVEIVNFVGGGALDAGKDRCESESTYSHGQPQIPLVIAGRTFTSRLIVGTGKYPSFAVMAQAHEASGAEMVTVAVRRVNFTIAARNRCSITSTRRRFILPNTAAATPRTRRFARRGSGARPGCRTG